MDAAAAAAMSDPDLNTYFRRRWSETVVDASDALDRRRRDGVGTLGLALQEALSRAARSGGAVHLRQQPEGPTDG